MGAEPFTSAIKQGRKVAEISRDASAGAARTAAETVNAMAKALGVPPEILLGQPLPNPPVFSPQPYPLFLADYSDGKPLVGRIIGWSVTNGGIPEPVVAFEDHGSTALPIRVNMTDGMNPSGAMWIRGSFEEAQAAAASYVPAKPAEEAR